MKTYIPFIALFVSVSASAGIKTISDQDPNESIAGLPAHIISALRMAGVPFQKLNNGVFLVSVKNLNCSIRAGVHEDISSPEAGVRRVECRKNSEEGIFPSKGVKLQEAVALEAILDNLGLSDCAMGQCAEFAKSVNCTIDTKVESYGGRGRFACTIEHTFD